jgi:uncharacterized protein YbaR (Trm112 family)
LNLNRDLSLDLSCNRDAIQNLWNYSCYRHLSYGIALCRSAFPHLAASNLVDMTLPALKANDLRWLVCPVCHESLQMEVDAVGCLGCARRFLIVDGIPVLLVDRAL